VTDGEATIIKYAGDEAETAVVPDQLDGNRVVKIGEWAFESCWGVEKIILPAGLISIGNGAFSGCGDLPDIIIPQNVIEIEFNPFSSCQKLVFIDVVAENPIFASIDGVLINNQLNTLVAYPIGLMADTYEVPNGIVSIGVSAFENSFFLTKIIIPDGVVSIGELAFFYSGFLSDINLPDSIESIGSFAFYACSNLTDMSLPDNLVSIGDGAFSYCVRLTNVILPSGLASIGDDAFYSCDNLTLTVTEGSYAHQYAKENDIPYTFGTDWLD